MIHHPKRLILLRRRPGLTTFCIRERRPRPRHLTAARPPPPSAQPMDQPHVGPPGPSTAPVVTTADYRLGDTSPSQPPPQTTVAAVGALPPAAGEVAALLRKRLGFLALVFAGLYF